jgi:hypothetical protein
MDLKTRQFFKPDPHHAMDGRASSLSSTDLATAAAVGLPNAVLPD